MKYRVWFLDVWGNETDGYEVNDRSSAGSVELPNDATDQDIIQALVDGEYLNSFSGKVADKFEIDGDDMSIYIDRKSDGMPLIQLEQE